MSVITVSPAQSVSTTNAAIFPAIPAAFALAWLIAAPAGTIVLEDATGGEVWYKGLGDEWWGANGMSEAAESLYLVDNGASYVIVRVGVGE